jgi:hypothetical protein
LQRAVRRLSGARRLLESYVALECRARWSRTISFALSCSATGAPLTRKYSAPLQEAIANIKARQKQSGSSSRQSLKTPDGLTVIIKSQLTDRSELIAGVAGDY